MQSVSNRTAKNRFCTSSAIDRSDILKWNISLRETLKICFVLINKNMTNEFEITVPAEISKFRTVSIISCR